MVDRVCPTLQALVYDILPSTTAVFSYAIGSRKLSANEQFFVGAQTVISLLQTTQITQGVSHTPSIAFRHLPPNSARFSYATEGALFISAQLSSDQGLQARSKDQEILEEGGGAGPSLLPRRDHE